jgi:hypothetical protein
VKVCFLIWGPSSSAKSGGAISGMGRMVLQPFVARGSRSYLEFWPITGNPDSSRL